MDSSLTINVSSKKLVEITMDGYTAMRILNEMLREVEPEYMEFFNTSKAYCLEEHEAAALRALAVRFAMGAISDRLDLKRIVSDLMYEDKIEKEHLFGKGNNESNNRKGF